MKAIKQLGERLIFWDGGTGSLLQQEGLRPGELPEIWNLTRPEVLQRIHSRYYQAGCDIVTANTFGANRLKLADCGYAVKDVIAAGIRNVKTARGKGAGLAAMDIGPTGRLLQPLGDLSFEDAYNAFAEAAEAGEAAGADLILIETMSDLYELKAAVLATKEHTSLPVIATVTFGDKGTLLTGADPACVVATLEGLGVDALGMNCGLGPWQMLPLVRELAAHASIPILVNPNAGLPESVDGKTVYRIAPEEFSKAMVQIAGAGAWLLGGCCGTTPEHIAAMISACRELRPLPTVPKEETVVASYASACVIGDRLTIIGERINPTGKARFKQALREQDVGYVLQEGVAQQSCGADILDVNVGLPEINEPALMERVVKELQGVTSLPLQIDTSDPAAMERALRCYNGKAMVNSVNGKRESMAAVFPLVKKYGGVVVGLTLDESGIPETAEGRLAVARRIVETAASYGIAKKNIVIDVLCMTVSSDAGAPRTTLDALALVRRELGVKTVLGVSNISFGLPKRETINSAFLTLALQRGLSCAIMNPKSDAMMNACTAYRALMGQDDNCQAYIARFGGEAPEKVAAKSAMTLEEAVRSGMKETAAVLTRELLLSEPAMQIIDQRLIPALNKVGDGFEKGTVFLPQLLMSAEAAKSAFDALKEHMARSGEVEEKKGRVVLATVEGDIHDIGKNIVKVLLDNYGFEVFDLGRDVPPQRVVDEAILRNAPVVGLSALMTTTVPAMEKTIKALRASGWQGKVVVGGAVLTKEYAAAIGADYYAKDAMSTVHFAQENC